jgi:hypothetical protein
MCTQELTYYFLGVAVFYLGEAICWVGLAALSVREIIEPIGLGMPCPWSAPGRIGLLSVG